MNTDNLNGSFQEIKIDIDEEKNVDNLNIEENSGINAFQSVMLIIIIMLLLFYIMLLFLYITITEFNEI